MKPVPTRPFQDPFPTLPAGFFPAKLSRPGGCFVEAPGSDLPEAGDIRTPPRTDRSGCGNQVREPLACTTVHYPCSEGGFC
jgi:hypothetical protein